MRIVVTSEDGVTLEMTVVDDPAFANRPHERAWRAHLFAEQLDVSVVGWEAGWQPESLQAFLKGIEDGWRGWEGERVWTSADGEVRLSARHNGVNAVLLSVSLQPRSPMLWRAEAELRLEPGRLSELRPRP